MVHELPQTICLVLCKRKLAEVAVYSFACSNCCRNKHLTPDYCGNVLESKGIGAGSFPIGCEGFVKASNVQGSSLLLSNANNCRILIYIYMYMYVCVNTYIYIYYSIGYDSVYIYIYHILWDVLWIYWISYGICMKLEFCCGNLKVEKNN